MHRADAIGDARPAPSSDRRRRHLADARAAADLAVRRWPCWPARRTGRIATLVDSPSLFIQLGAVGLQNGALYALIALGYTLVYGIIELINFAHGDLFMLGDASSPAS